MPLSAGDKLSQYQVLAPLGAGGMGEVYRAHDTQLERDVAIKVLPRALANDPERLARFDREAKILAALNHPNIAVIYGLVESDGQRALAMELVSGETLADRMKRGPMPLDEILPIARQMAEALEAAHERGVVHRDLKPANVMITPTGQVKVLDFGLAAMAQPGPSAPGDPTNSPTLTMGMTQAGVIMGTAAYMAPEQAAGTAVDKRADIWSFGVVLFELLSGQRLFSGDTVAHTLADVLRAPIEFEKVTGPAPIKNLLRRCLDRNVATRLRDIGEARIAIQKWLANPVEEESNSPVQVEVRATPSKLPWATAAGLAVLSVALGALSFVHLREPQPALVKLEFLPPEKASFPIVNGPPAVSPDGHRVAFIAQADRASMLWVRDLDSLGARALPGTEGANVPFWAPDSRQVGFYTQGKLMKIDVMGGPAVTIASIPNFRGASWSSENVIVFFPNSGGLMRVSAAGGIPAPATELDKSRNETVHRRPHFLPDGHHFLYLALSSDPEKNAIFAGDVQSNERKLVVQAASNVQYVEPIGAGDGHILFAREETLMAQPFNASKRETTGDAVPIAEHVFFNSANFYGYFGASRNGVLAYATGGGTNGLQLTWYDRTGKVVGTVGKPVDVQALRLSPDGKMVATDRMDPQSRNRDIWLYDLVRGTEQRLTFADSNQIPVWSPDGLRVAYSRGIPGIPEKLVAKAADGTGQEEELDTGKAPSDWSRDGNVLLTMTPNATAKTGGDIWAVPFTGPNAHKPAPLLHSQFNENWAKLSPDGRWLAYQSNESKRNEVYVVGFPSLNGHWQISADGGGRPVWSRDGRELYFVSADNKMMAVEIKPGAQFVAGVPKPLFDVRLGTGGLSYDVSADGRFLIATPAEQSATMPMTVVLNWQSGLKK